jgi:hypothetical protein
VRRSGLFPGLLFGLSVFSAATLSGFSTRSGPPADPLSFVQNALGQHRIVFLGDIHLLVEPKFLVAQWIKRKNSRYTIDLLALEVASEQQEWIDRYLESQPEDTSILLDHPRTLRAHWGVSREYLEIYRSVYQWNAHHPGRRVYILAADLLGWPIAPLTEHMATGGFVNRDIWMARSFEKVLDQHPQWRVLIFMGGYHGLKAVGGEVALGRSHDRFDRWFAGYLAQDGTEVYTILTDARQEGGRPATRMFDYLTQRRRGTFAVELDTTTDVVREPVYDVEQEGFHLEFWPARFALRSAVEAMLILERPSPITLIH